MFTTQSSYSYIHRVPYSYPVSSVLSALPKNVENLENFPRVCLTPSKRTRIIRVKTHSRDRRVIKKYLFPVPASTPLALGTENKRVIRGRHAIRYVIRDIFIERLVFRV